MNIRVQQMQGGNGVHQSPAQIIASPDLRDSVTQLPLAIVLGSDFLQATYIVTGNLVFLSAFLEFKTTTATPGIDLLLPLNLQPFNVFDSISLCEYTRIDGGGIAQAIPTTVWIYDSTNAGYGVPYLEFTNDYTVPAIPVVTVLSPGGGGTNYPMDPEIVQLQIAATWILR